MPLGTLQNIPNLLPAARAKLLRMVANCADELQTCAERLHQLAQAATCHVDSLQPFIMTQQQQQQEDQTSACTMSAATIGGGGFTAQSAADQLRQVTASLAADADDKLSMSALLIDQARAALAHFGGGAPDGSSDLTGITSSITSSSSSKNNNANGDENKPKPHQYTAVSSSNAWRPPPREKMTPSNGGASDAVTDDGVGTLDPSALSLGPTVTIALAEEEVPPPSSSSPPAGASSSLPQLLPERLLSARSQVWLSVWMLSPRLGDERQAEVIMTGLVETLAAVAT